VLHELAALRSVVILKLAGTRQIARRSAGPADLPCEGRPM
jgi:hypothetical protein